MKTEHKKILIISYYWPPAGGPGVQRWLKFVKYLPDYNIQPIVYIPENPSYPILDQNLIDEVTKETIIISKPIFEPYQLASFIAKDKTKTISSGLIPNQKKQTKLDKFLLWIRGNLFIPDARVYWVKPSVRFLKKYIKEHDIQTIITTGPPHSLHLIGLKLQKETSANWIADFRDPWTTIGYQKALKLSSFAQKKHKFLEHQVLNAANTIIVTSTTTKKEFQAITSKPIEVITNGYDNTSKNDKILDEKFTISHIGSFLSDRNPIILWEVISELISENLTFAKDLKLNLIGKISDEIINEIQKYNLVSHCNTIGYVNHNQAIEYQQKSQVLLLIEIDSEGTRSIIPGKLFEYMIAERPIIAIGPNQSDMEQIIVDTQTGVFIHYHEKEKLKQVVLNYYEHYQNNCLQVYPVGLEKYSRKFLTQKLAQLIANKS